MQGFRALNQALGRGLRHSNDWCAILLFDIRFINKKRKPKSPVKFNELISRWIRNCLQHSNDFKTNLAAYIKD
uniref:ATP-dependent helicase C-terminal domain-containing protein n=1 Tax=Panagrolaimus davidi TaxID=227884 RepID=A0A914PKZ2_9BILA